MLNSKGVVQSVKGHIVATRFATEESPRVNSKLFAEDPQTEGESQLDERATQALADATVGIHYSKIALKLNQPLLAAALWNGVRLPAEILLPVTLWRLEIDPVQERIFVGGYYPGPTGVPAFTVRDGSVQRANTDPFRLDQPNGTFIGVEIGIFRSLVASCRSTGTLGRQIPQLESSATIYSAISMLRDGSVLGPIELFTPIQRETM